MPSNNRMNTDPALRASGDALKANVAFRLAQGWNAMGRAGRVMRSVGRLQEENHMPRFFSTKRD